MNPDQLRQQVANKCGPERFDTFLKTFCKRYREKRRLAFWQQDILGELAIDHPSIAELTIDDMIPAFYMCHVHKRQLIEKEIPVLRDVLDVYTDRDFEQQMIEHFPYSPQYVITVDGQPTKEPRILPTCPQCEMSRRLYENKLGNRRLN